MFKKQFLLLGGIGILTSVLSGCALVPYSSNYPCPESKSIFAAYNTTAKKNSNGDCFSLTKNYKLSLHEKALEKMQHVNSKINNCPISLRGTKACLSYGKSLSLTSVLKNRHVVKFNEVTSMRVALYKYMLQSQTPPLWMPASVKKALILPYSTKNIFHGFTEIYFITNNGKWLMGNYLYKKYQSNKSVIFKIIGGE